MALLNCIYCGHRVSDKASNCPCCGAPVVRVAPRPKPAPPVFNEPEPKPKPEPQPEPVLESEAQDVLDFGEEPSHTVRNLIVAVLCIVLCGALGYGLSSFYYKSHMPRPRFDVEALADSLNVDSIVVADAVAAQGFTNDDDVFSYLKFRKFTNKSSDVTVRVDRDGIYGNGAKLASNPTVTNIEPTSAVITSGRYRLRLDKTQGTLTDLYDNATYE